MNRSFIVASLISAIAACGGEAPAPDSNEPSRTEFSDAIAISERLEGGTVRATLFSRESGDELAVFEHAVGSAPRLVVDSHEVSIEAPAADLPITPEALELDEVNEALYRAWRTHVDADGPDARGEEPYTTCGAYFDCDEFSLYGGLCVACVWVYPDCSTNSAWTCGY